MKVYLLYRRSECVDCGNEGILEDIFTALSLAVEASMEVGSLWIEQQDGNVRTWRKHRGTHWIEEWEIR